MPIVAKALRYAKIKRSAITIVSLSIHDSLIGSLHDLLYYCSNGWGVLTIIRLYLLVQRRFGVEALQHAEERQQTCHSAQVVDVGYPAAQRILEIDVVALGGLHMYQHSIDVCGHFRRRGTRKSQTGVLLHVANTLG